MRDPCSAAYLLARLSDTIADTAAVPTALRVRLLREFRETLHDDRAPGSLEESLEREILPCLHHEGERVLVRATGACFRHAFAQPPVLADSIRAVLDEITTGQTSDLTAFAGAEPGSLACLKTRDDLVRYTDQVAGSVGRFWTTVGWETCGRFSEFPPADLHDLGTRYGRALQLVNILRALPEDLAAGRCYLPASELRRQGWDFTRPWTEQKPVLLAVVSTWEQTAHAGLLSGRDYASSLTGRRTAIATALPARLGLQTLRLLQASGDQRLQRKVKIPRREVRRTLGRTVWNALLHGPLNPGETAQNRPEAGPRDEEIPP